MAFLKASVTKASSTKVEVDRREKISVEVEPIGSRAVEVEKATKSSVSISTITTALMAIVTFVSSIALNVYADLRPRFEVSTTGKIQAEATIIYTVPVAEDAELWWCEGWKVLWNNGIAALWRKA